MAEPLPAIHLETRASTAAVAAIFCSARARWRMKRPRAMVMLTRSVPSTTRPARASIRVAPRALPRGREDILNRFFISDHSHLAGQAGEEEPLVEIGADEVNCIGGSETGRRAVEGDFAVECGLAGDVDLIDGKAARK